MLKNESDRNELAEELLRLHDQNARLKMLLEAHGIPWEIPAPEEPRAQLAQLTTPEEPAQRFTKAQAMRLPVWNKPRVIGCFMQCGPIQHRAARPEAAPTQLEVWPQRLPTPEIPAEAGIQDVFHILANNANRNRRITEDILAAYAGGRKIIVLTERTEHLKLLREALGDAVKNCFVLHGRLAKKQRAAIYADLTELEDSAPRVLLATGRLIGEGFDHPPLDTLVLAMPISWKGTLQQYAGRLHREHTEKQDVRIYDYIEYDHLQLARMWEKRQRGYRAMGYQVRAGEECQVQEKRLEFPPVWTHTNFGRGAREQI